MQAIFVQWRSSVDSSTSVAMSKLSYVVDVSGKETRTDSLMKLTRASEKLLKFGVQAKHATW